MSKTCDRLVVLHQGKMVAQGTQEELTKHLSGTRVNITVRNSIDQLTQWLDGHPMVTGHTTKGSADGCTSATVDMNGDNREALIADLVNSEFNVRLVEEPEYDLEEVFLRFTSTRTLNSTRSRMSTPMKSHPQRR